MKNLKLLILSIILFSHNGAMALEKDKQLHLGLSTVISGVTYGLLTREYSVPQGKAYVGAVALTLLVGHVKELQDEKYDKNDMIANSAGALLGPALFIMWEFE